MGELADFIATRKSRIIGRWKERVVERLAVDLEHSELIDHLPDFLDDVVLALRDPEGSWPSTESARRHGQMRMRAGIDIGAMTEEMSLITEVASELAGEEGVSMERDDFRRLVRVVSRGTAASVTAYATMRDAEMAKQATEHFSFLAHELRTPLQTAQMATQLLEGASEKQRDRYVRKLERAIAQMMGLVNGVLDRMRSAGTIRPDPQRVSSRSLVNRACTDLSDHAEARGLSIERHVQDFDLDVDPGVFLSALTNLVKNATQFTPEGGSIKVRARQESGRALFEVEDECGGMPPELPPRLFQPFVQADADKGGFGLGLTIVKQAAEAHGGAVRVANRPGEGCTFVLDVPVRNGVQSEESEQGEPATPNS